ncbi:hypothetical protein [uncultured Planktosalinus sp.]|uniref:hypothetical protein n=1 Tax=uncultured Planktosalinus sp. TaxID=1810935 RepID=UPI0030D9B1B9
MKNTKFIKALLPLLFIAALACEDVLFEEDISSHEVFLLAPSDNSVVLDSLVNFSWNTLQGATKYQIQIAIPNFSSPSQIIIDSTFIDTLNSNTQRASLILPDNEYQWRVRAQNNSSQTAYTINSFSVEARVFDEDISNETLTLLSPSNNATLDIKEITFNWESVNFSENYKIQIATPNFENPLQVVFDSITSDTNVTHILDNGIYEWRVKAKNSSSETAYSSRSFVVDALTFNGDISQETVILVAPPNGTELNISDINFTWGAIEFAEDYQLQIATPNFTNPVQVVVNEILAETTSTQTLEDGTYEWRVKARNSSSQTPYTSAGFTVAISNDVDISSQTVQLIAPSNGSILDFQDINFTWQGVTNAEEYFIEIATPNFTNPTQSYQNTVFTTSYMQTLNEGSYEWRVQARNAISQTPFSNINAFTVTTQDSFPDRVVYILSPPNNFISNQASLNIQWQMVQDAALYRIQVLNANTNQLLDEQTTTQTNTPFTFPEGELLWQVRAETNSQNTQYTTQSITIDTQAPNSPMLLSPTDTAVLTSTNVTFTWERTPIPGTPEQDVIYIYDDVSLSNLVLQENVSTGTFTTTLSNNTTYYWLMNAIDEAGNQSEDSDVFSLSIEE